MNPTMGNSNGQNGNSPRWGMNPGGRFSGGNFGLNRQIQGGGPMLQQSRQGGLAGMGGALINRFRQQRQNRLNNQSAGDALMNSPGGPSGPGGPPPPTPPAVGPSPMGPSNLQSQPPSASPISSMAPPMDNGSNVVAHHESIPDNGGPATPAPASPSPTGNLNGVIQNHGAPTQAPSPTPAPPAGNPMPAGFNPASQPIFNIPGVPGGPGSPPPLASDVDPLTGQPRSAMPIGGGGMPSAPPPSMRPPINSMRPGGAAMAPGVDQAPPSLLGPYGPGGGESGQPSSDTSNPYNDSGGPGGPGGGAIAPGQDERRDNQMSAFAHGGFAHIAKMHPMHMRAGRMSPPMRSAMAPPAVPPMASMGAPPPAGLPPGPSGPPPVPGAQIPQYAGGGIVPSIAQARPLPSSNSQVLANPVPMARQMMRYRTQGGPMSKLEAPTTTPKYSVDSGKFGSKRFPMPRSEMRSMTSPAFQ